jgi:hypothetical protein
MSETKATILVIDRKASLVMELRYDLKTTHILLLIAIQRDEESGVAVALIRRKMMMMRPSLV